MGKGLKNAPSTTGKPSGKGRGNNPPRAGKMKALQSERYLINGGLRVCTDTASSQ